MQLIELRKKKNLTMQQVCERAGISLAMYCQIENGQRNPSVRTAKRLARVLGIRWTKFFDNVQ